MGRTILITNDDGIYKDGLMRLARACVRFGDVWLIAPRHQRSACSHSITLDVPIDITPVPYAVEGVRAYSCSGMPGDCVRIGTKAVMDREPDVVLAGINYGYNAATDIQYSATVGAVLEASFLGYRGIALSENDGLCHEVTDRYLEEVLEELIDLDPGSDQVWNVNFPGCPLAACSGILRDRTMSQAIVYEDWYQPARQLPGGGIRYVVSGEMQCRAEAGSDFDAILRGAVSIGRVRNLC